MNSDNAGVNVYPVGDALFAACDTTVIRRVDVETLATLDAVS